MKTPKVLHVFLRYCFEGPLVKWAGKAKCGMRKGGLSATMAALVFAGPKNVGAVKVVWAILTLGTDHISQLPTKSGNVTA